MSVLIALGAGVFGALVGTFLTVVVHRLPPGRSLVSLPSSCPACGNRIKASDSIPVLSWLMLRGRCRRCRTRISVRYPLVELGTAIFFGVVTWWMLAGFGPFAPVGTLVARPSASAGGGAAEITATMLVLAAFLYLAAISVALALIDLDARRLPNAIVLPAYLVGGMLLTSASILTGEYGSLFSAAVGMVVLWLAYFLVAWAAPGGMGFGDVKLAGVLGLYLGSLGWGPLMVGAFAAFLLGGLFSIALLLLRRANRKSGIPFGPWMLAGAWVGIFFGDTISTIYLELYGLG